MQISSSATCETHERQVNVTKEKGLIRQDFRMTLSRAETKAVKDQSRKTSRYNIHRKCEWLIKWD